MAILKAEFEQMVKDRVTQQLGEAGVPNLQDISAEIEKQVTQQMEKARLEFLGEKETTPGEDPKSGFKNFSHFAQALWKAEVNPRNVDPLLLAMEKTARQKAAGSPTLAEGDADAGGYLIPEEFRNTLLELAIEKSNILNLAVVVPMASNAIRMPYISGFDHSGSTVHGGITWSWLDENAQKTATKPAFGTIGMRLHKIAGLCYASDEILEDSPISLEPLLSRLFTDSLAWQLDDVFINGTGAAQPLGILNAPCTVSQAKETGQAADTIVYENIIEMYQHLYNKRSAIWMANHDTFAQLASMSLDVGTGGLPVYLPSNGASGRPYDTLMGQPLILSEHCKTVGTVGDIFLADWTQYLVGQKAGAGSGVKFDTSIHLKFDFDQSAFRFVFRIDGQPWWPTYLTPQNGTNYLTPFVTLASRD